MHLRHLRRLAAAVTVIGNVVVAAAADVGEEELRAQHQWRRRVALFLAEIALD